MSTALLFDVRAGANYVELAFLVWSRLIKDCTEQLKQIVAMAREPNGLAAWHRENGRLDDTSLFERFDSGLKLLHAAASVVCSKASILRAKSSISMPLFAWFRMASAARRRTEGGVFLSSRIVINVDTASVEAC